MKTLMMFFLVLGFAQTLWAEDEAGGAAVEFRDFDATWDAPRGEPQRHSQRTSSRPEAVENCKCQAYINYNMNHSLSFASAAMMSCLAASSVRNPSYREVDWKTHSRYCPRYTY
jgi:hypothetical protein